MKRFPLWSVLIPFLSIVPFVALFILVLWVLAQSMGSSVTNIPEEDLSRSLASFRSAHRSSAEKLGLQARRFAEGASLSEALKDTAGNRERIASLCRDLAQTAGFGFLVLSDPDGGVLYDNLGLPVPSPSPKDPPPPTKGGSKSKSPKEEPTPIPSPSIRDWPALERLGTEESIEGLAVNGGGLFQVHALPLKEGGKIRGFLFLGEQITLNRLHAWKEACGRDLALYSQVQTWSTHSLPPPPLDPAVLRGEGSAPLTLTLGEEDLLGGRVPLAGLDGSLPAVALVLEPVVRAPILTGSPREEIARMGLWVLLGAAFILSILVGWFHHSAKRLVAAMRRIQEGDYTAPVPSLAGEWGTMADALRDTTTALREKQRISLVLGKVVSPQTAKTLLEERDLFALKGEKRECTLLHADLRGFNDLSRNMEPPALVEALNLYFGLINEIVFKYEGMMDKFVGEAALAVWGAPFTHEDKEMRAVRAALEIQETLKEFNISRIKKGHPPFTVGIGIHTGQVVSGNLGSERRCDYTVIGEPLHVASRLCAMASPGQIVVSEETHLKVQPLVSSKPLNPLAVKGSLEPLKTYEITALL